MNDAHDNALDDKAMLEKFSDDSYIKAAEAIGTDHGKIAASWVFDGNTTRESYARYLKGIENGDPETMDSLCEPSLSGEYADDYDEQMLAVDLDLGMEDIETLEECAEAYNRAAASAFWLEVERMARYQLDAG